MSRKYFEHHFISMNTCTSEIYHGYTGTFCPNCFHPFMFKMDFNISITNTDLDGEHPYVNKSINVLCPKCEQRFDTSALLDPDITEAIARLNMKGYTTKFCCQGHASNTRMIRYDESGGIFDRPDINKSYIVFSGSDILKVIKKYPLPEGWKIRDVVTEEDSDAVISGIDDDFDFDETKFITNIDYANAVMREYEDKYPLEERLSALNTWVDSLPSWECLKLSLHKEENQS